MARQRPAGPARHAAHPAQADRVRPGPARWGRTGRSALQRLVRDRRTALGVFGAVAVALTGLTSMLAAILVS
jgi:hypothetical protein